MSAHFPQDPPCSTRFDAGTPRASPPSSSRRSSGAGPIRDAFKESFARAGLPSFNPHSFRKTLVRLAYELQLGPADLKAWSQNLGHDGVLTALKSYGELPAFRQKELIRAAVHAGEDDAVALRIGREMMLKVRNVL